MELAGLDTELVTPVPLALITAMGAMGQRYLEKVSAMVHLERDRSFLVIANRGQWVFSRTFPSVLAPEARQAASRKAPANVSAATVTWPTGNGCSSRSTAACSTSIEHAARAAPWRPG